MKHLLKWARKSRGAGIGIGGIILTVIVVSILGLLINLGAIPDISGFLFGACCGSIVGFVLLGFALMFTESCCKFK